MCINNKCYICFSIFLSLFPNYYCSAKNLYSTNKETEKVSQVDFHSLGTIIGERIIITKDVDLKGGECILPEGFTLDFREAILRNGTLVGNNSRIKCSGAIFDHISISGNWNVPVIRTSMFADIKEENSLQNVFALASPTIQNSIKIEKGLYRVRARYEWDRCLTVCSNTNIILNGDIILTPNKYRGCDILYIAGDNVEVKGKGSITGDKMTHQGSTGEWGMGINILQSENVKIEGLTVKNCWGDCIYVGNNSRNIIINHCKIINGRRQGISITSAKGVEIKKTEIKDVNGTAPEYAIDLEPNEGDTVEDVIINRLRIENCRGGIVAYGKAQESKLGQIAIVSCKISVVEKSAISITKSDYVLIKKNLVVQPTGKRVVVFNDINDVLIKNNQLQCKKEYIKSDNQLINIANCNVKQYRRNKVRSL